MTTEQQTEYLAWLKSQVNTPMDGRYDGLLEKLYEREFSWTVPNDDNRVEDGLDLRAEFTGGPHHDVNDKGVSVLEIIVGLSRRLEFNAEGNAKDWAWTLIGNIGLDKMKDPLRIVDENIIDEVLDQLIWRTYDRDGQGGFFPLAEPQEDQTKLEIWYQMSAYIYENS